jgi:hypothetical protein
MGPKDPLTSDLGYVVERSSVRECELAEFVLRTSPHPYSYSYLNSWARYLRTPQRSHMLGISVSPAIFIKLRA